LFDVSDAIFFLAIGLINNPKRLIINILNDSGRFFA
jgi:hypothetical protein